MMGKTHLNNKKFAKPFHLSNLYIANVTANDLLMLPVSTNTVFLSTVSYYPYIIMKSKTA